MTSFTRAILVVYGLALIGGGTMGYVRQESLPSLLAGGACGLLALAGFLVSLKKPAVGFGLGFLVAAAVAGMMGKRCFVDQAPFMPAGMVALVSAAVALIVLAVLFSGKK